MAPLVRVTRNLAIGAAVAIGLTGCTSNTTPTAARQSEGRPFTPLANMKAIGIDNDPLQEVADSLDDTPTYLAEVRAESLRLLLYVNSDGCGFVSVSNTEPRTIDINLTSKWPTGQDNTKTPTGGYNTASASGTDDSWAQLKCSKSAMTVEYKHPSVKVESQRGIVSIAEPTNQHPSLLLVAGEQRARKPAFEWSR
ncbi:hypothetical protein [Streptomyces sp. NPDC058434]|uniref:hypothetical protein n=1 Tax=Streptomyces sp. NPDC058434 TaxID=3346498 RepID=UPI00366713CE